MVSWIKMNSFGVFIENFDRGLVNDKIINGYSINILNPKLILFFFFFARKEH